MCACNLMLTHFTGSVSEFPDITSRPCSSVIRAVVKTFPIHTARFMANTGNLFIPV